MFCIYDRSYNTLKTSNMLVKKKPTSMKIGTKVRVLYKDGKWYNAKVIAHPEKDTTRAALEHAQNMICVEYDSGEWDPVYESNIELIEKKRKRAVAADDEDEFIDDAVCEQKAVYTDIGQPIEMNVSLSMDQAIHNLFDILPCFGDMDRVDQAVQDCVRSVRHSCKTPRMWHDLTNLTSRSRRVAPVTQKCAMCGATKTTTWLFSTEKGNHRLGVDCASKATAAVSVLRWRSRLFDFEDADEAVAEFNRLQLALYGCQ
jgi:hypothetical protein